MGHWHIELNLIPNIKKNLILITLISFGVSQTYIHRSQFIGPKLIYVLLQKSKRVFFTKIFRDP